MRGKREIVIDPTNTLQETLKIEVMDDPAAGNAPSVYEIFGYTAKDNPSWEFAYQSTILLFQQGTLTEKGPNGLTMESIITVLIDRLQCFQSGPFANELNGEALRHLVSAREALFARTRERQARGVEGTMQP
jgi:hypothetical protein